MNPLSIGIVGGGWRAEFYIRIAQALPNICRIQAMVIRNEDKGEEIEKRWGIRTFRTIANMAAATDIDFAVVSVPRSVAPAIIAELVEHNIPALAETPPAADLQSLISLHESLPVDAKVQVAEQYLFQPMHAARIALVRSGKLGKISHAQVSAAHDYHGVSLIRQLLGIKFEDAVISGQRYSAPIVEGPGRQGDPSAERMRTSQQSIVTLRFGDKLAVYDFTGEQYFSWIRRNRMVVRGSHGEIVDQSAAYLLDYETPIYTELRRVDTGHNGNLEGYYHRGIIAGEEWVYRNPFQLARLSDDEIAIATALVKMGEYVKGGPSFYSLAEASQDHYLALMMEQAINEGKEVVTSHQIWTRPRV
ncbi:MAG: Gfo/Idh/MocA family protein [Candidatus Pristimantibacillus sp.]